MAEASGTRFNHPSQVALVPCHFAPPPVFGQPDDLPVVQWAALQVQRVQHEVGIANRQNVNCWSLSMVSHSTLRPGGKQGEVGL